MAAAGILVVALHGPGAKHQQQSQEPVGKRETTLQQRNKISRARCAFEMYILIDIASSLGLSTNK